MTAPERFEPAHAHAHAHAHPHPPSHLPLLEQPQPTLTTPRLLVRPYHVSDAVDLQRLAGDRRIAATTRTIPHPYPDGAAEAWISLHPGQWRAGTHASFAVIHRERGELLGGVGLVIDAEERRAELGYWIAVPAWGHGYATEAAQAVCAFGFRALGLHRIHAHHLASNTASGQVMEKLGMRPEGVLRQHSWKWGECHDLVVRGLLASEWPAFAPAWTSGMLS